MMGVLNSILGGGDVIKKGLSLLMICTPALKKRLLQRAMRK